MTDQELTRRAKRRLAILRHAEEITGNVALTCRWSSLEVSVRPSVAAGPCSPVFGVGPLAVGWRRVDSRYSDPGGAMTWSGRGSTWSR